MAWQRSKFRIGDNVHKWEDVSNSIVRIKLRNHFMSPTQIACEMKKSGKMKYIGTYWYRFIND